jgi:hypothetical protein
MEDIETALAQYESTQRCQRGWAEKTKWINIHLSMSWLHVPREQNSTFETHEC